MGIFRKRTIFFWSLFCTLLLFVGCASEAEPPASETAVSDAEWESYVSLVERPLPDPEDSAEGLAGGGILSERDCCVLDGRLCFLYAIGAPSGEHPGEFVYDGLCIRVLEVPYERWKSCTVGRFDWGGELPYYPEKLIAADSEGIRLCLTATDGKLERSYLGLCRWDGTCEILEEDAGLGVRSRQGIRSVFGPDGSELRYGLDEQGVRTLWTVSGGQKPADIRDTTAKRFTEFVMCSVPSGEYYLADVSGIWKITDTAQEVCTFLDGGIVPEKILGITQGESGGLLVFCRYEEGLYLLDMDRFLEICLGGRKAITVALYQESPGLEWAAARFNRQNGRYRVSILYGERETDSPEDFRRSIRLQLAAGKGPDLLGNSVIEEAGAVRSGYVQSLDDVIQDSSSLTENVMESGKRNGRVYGIPYEYAPYTLVFSEELAQGRNSWTLREMREAVEKSSAEVLCPGYSGIAIVLHLGLSDPGNTEFLDWEKGESHLTKQPFLDFLAFAKKYEDTDFAALAQEERYVAEKKAAAVQEVFNLPSAMCRVRSAFGGQESFVGFPVEEGSGIFFLTSSLYLNHATACREGAVEFLRFLLSKEGQMCCAEGTYMLSVRPDVNEYMIARYQEEETKAQEIRKREEQAGIYSASSTAPLDDGQLRAYRAVIADAEPEFYLSREFQNLVSEELEPYFAGFVTAKEAAARLDNRVQLYLNENRR